MPRFEHQRHKIPSELTSERELVLVCPALKSRVNLSRIIRLAGCFGIQRVIACRPFSLDSDITRDALEFVQVESRGALVPVLKRLKTDGYQIVGLEQTTNSSSLYEFEFPKRTALLLGHERLGIPADQLAQVNEVIEIPVFGKPMSFNVATACTMAVYEYCRQNPTG
ncbi:MAG: RNA methyltransferase [Planctomycetaceae bacterium]|nr:RNA methyltransferase [Planctomycetaceae bacterium]MCP4464157.1 RNA methyltransferase [Planctomycetaceae bacterium]